MLEELPNDWKWVKLGNVTERITKGGTPTTYGFKFQNQGIRFLKIENVKEGKVLINSISDFISEEAHAYQKKSQLEVGDLLFSIAGTIGETCAIKEEFLPANTNQAFAIIRGAQKEFDLKFLQFQLQSFVAKIKVKARGGAMNNVSLEDLKNFDSILPPKPTQLAIVAKIEELFSELDKGIEQLKTAQQQLKTYRQSVLKWAFEGKLTAAWRVDNISRVRIPSSLPDIPMAAEDAAPYEKESELPEGWKIVSITELAEKGKHALKAGPFGSSLKKEFYVEKGYKIYGQEQVINDDPFFGDYYIDDSKYQELGSCKIQPFDILISLVGTVGKVLLLPENCEPGIINPRLIKISLDKTIYSPKFFKYYFESSTVKSFYKAETRGTTMDVLNLGIIKTIPFPLCSIKEQDQVVREIESRLSVADNMEESINQSLQQAEALRQSILKQAFEGKLVE